MFLWCWGCLGWYRCSRCGSQSCCSRLSICWLPRKGVTRNRRTVLLEKQMAITLLPLGYSSCIFRPQPTKRFRVKLIILAGCLGVYITIYDCILCTRINCHSTCYLAPYPVNPQVVATHFFRTQVFYIATQTEDAWKYCGMKKLYSLPYQYYDSVDSGHVCE